MENGWKAFVAILAIEETLKAELWGIRRVLLLCKERNWKGIQLESNYLNAVNFITGDEVEGPTHSNQILIDDCKELIVETNASLVHILREANRCADILA